MEQTTVQGHQLQKEDGEYVAAPISDFITRPDFPECTRGNLVNIGGYTGTVVDIVGNSLKVRSPEEITRSFNAHILRKLYGPREELKPLPSTSGNDSTRTVSDPEPEAPKRNVIEDPDYSNPPKLISQFTGAADYPQNTLGQHVDIGGYQGVVVEIVKGSLKVRSADEVIRSYNSQTIRKLYPPS